MGPPSAKNPFSWAFVSNTEIQRKKKGWGLHVEEEGTSAQAVPAWTPPGPLGLSFQPRPRELPFPPALPQVILEAVSSPAHSRSKRTCQRAAFWSFSTPADQGEADTEWHLPPLVGSKGDDHGDLTHPTPTGGATSRHGKRHLGGWGRNESKALFWENGGLPKTQGTQARQKQSNSRTQSRSPRRRQGS